MPDIREIREDELESLLSLYQFLNLDDPKMDIDDQLKKHWQDIYMDPGLKYLVAEENGQLVSSCCLAVIKNLTRSARPYGLIENMVTHPRYRKKGYGTIILKHAVEIARKENCYKVMLLTSRKDEATWRFYEAAGFNRGDKTGFIVRF
ncbi:MAG: GNAT family N-acetyltransferase [Methylocystaceae bacterium]